jgi:hypothetical protein
VYGPVRTVVWEDGGREAPSYPIRTWNQLHLWASLTMIAGVLAHLLLHAKWITCMTQRVFGEKRRKPKTEEACPAPRGVISLPRRRFLTIGGVALAAGAVLATCGATAGLLARVLEREGGDEPVVVSDQKTDRRVKPELAEPLSGGVIDPPPAAEVEAPAPATPAATPVEATPVPVPTATPEAVVEMCVSCPRGLVNDPYPGRCRLYVDQDGDGICDRSVPQTCG